MQNTQLRCMFKKLFKFLFFARYVCDTDGNIVCQPGWQEPLVRDATSLLNPCLEPICDHNGLGCVHGDCRAPGIFLKLCLTLF